MGNRGASVTTPFVLTPSGSSRLQTDGSLLQRLRYKSQIGKQWGAWGQARPPLPPRKANLLYSIVGFNIALDFFNACFNINKSNHVCSRMSRYMTFIVVHVSISKCIRPRPPTSTRPLCELRASKLRSLGSTFPGALPVFSGGSRPLKKKILIEPNL